MAEETTPTPRKHRVIAWQPEPIRDPSQERRRLPRWAVILGTVGGTLFVLLALLTGLVVYKFYRYQQEQAAAEMGGGAPVQTPAEAFASRSRAEFARDSAMRGMNTVRATPAQHPAVIQRLIALERSVIQADKAFGETRYGQAVQLFDTIAGDTKALTDDLEDMRKAREGYSSFVTELTRLTPFKEFDPEKFEAALTAAGASQAMLDEGSFNLARAKMDEAQGILASIDKALKAELEACLADGRKALSEGNGKEARSAFEDALRLEAGNEVAIQGLERAKTVDQLFALLAEADKHEQAGALEVAGEIFERAFALDKQSATAQAGIARVKASIRQRDFEKQVAAGKAATEAKEWKAAITAYSEALKLFPDNEEVKHAIAEARVYEREAYITTSLADAFEMERSYQWDAAQRIYLSLLDFEPGQPDAEEGLLRTGKVIRALLRFNRQIDEARGLAQRAQFQNAIMTFNEAMASKPAYLTLTPEQEQLRATLERESRPVSVSFVSDSRTYVTIEGVQIIGRFTQVSVPLLPGNYQIVGRRKGYEDVHEVIRVRSNEAVPPVTIVASRKQSM